MPPLRVNAAALGDGMSRLNGRPGSSTNALRGGANGLAGARGSSPSRSNGEGVDILAVLKQAARQEPAAALRELQRLHSQLTGAAGSKALGSLESAWQQQASDDPGAPGGGSSGSGGGRAGVGGAGGNSATQNAITAQQRELNQLTIQRQRLQQQQREQRNELHSVTSELEKRKNELRQVSDQLKQRRSMIKGSGSPRAPTPPRGSPGADSRSPGGTDGSTTERGSGGSASGGGGASEPIVPKLQVGSAAPSKASSAPSAPAAAGSKDGETPGVPRADKDGKDEDGESLSEKLEGLQEELEDARGDLQLTISDLRVILEATPAFVCAVDPHGHVSGWNTAAIEITGLRREGVLQRHFVEHFVPQQHQQSAADAMEAAFSLPADDPLAGEPGEPFDLTLWRGSGTAERSSMVTIKVRAYARRLSGGQPVGLLLIQDDAGSNEGNKERTKIEQEVVELNQVLALRDQELEEHEAELASLRAELHQFYEEKASREGKLLSKPAQTGANGAAATKVPGILAKGQVAPNGLMPGSGQRIQWGKPNHVGHFTKGSSPREFGNKNRHEQLKEQVMGPDKLTGGTQQTPAVQPTR